MKYVLGLAVLVLVLSGCELADYCTRGSGVIISETRNVEAFDSVEFSGWGDVYVTQGSPSSLRIEAEDNIMPLLMTNVVDGVLKIHPTQWCVHNTKPVKVYVTIPEVKRLGLSGSGDIVSESLLVADDLEVQVSGSGDIRLNADVNRLRTIISGSGNADLKGSADRHELQISGSGSLYGFDLLTHDSALSISGSGSAEAYAMESLDVVISGSGDVVYRGDPVVNEQISGSGSVRKE